MRFIVAHQSGLYSMTDLCATYGVSRRIGYKWISRFEADGPAGLLDRSRAPKSSPQRMDPALEELLLDAREAHPRWGPRKILAWAGKQHPELEGVLPAASTTGDLFRRHGLIEPRRRRRLRTFECAGALRAEAANDVWAADYKGEFRLGNGRYFYPFTLTDAHTRYLLSCQGQPSTSLRGAQASFLEAFRSFGLPKAIRTDNGTPFVGQGLSGLSTLSVWWIQLGIRHQRIPKGRPDQNGRHERMHRTLAAETTRPPEATETKQQARFDDFRREYNDERPHEALGQETPASQYQSSPRPYPERIVPPEYPGYYERRKFNNVGGFRFRGLSIFVAQPLAGETLGLVEIEEDIWSLRYYDHELGRINPRTGTVNIKVLPMSSV
jgi:transposase InsO family protein